MDEEKQRIIRAGGFVKDGRINSNLNLSRAIGDLDYKKNSQWPKTEQIIIALPEVTKINLTPEDEYILIGCDGIFENKSNDSIIANISQKFVKGLSLPNTIEELLSDTLAPDTMSFLFFSFSHFS